MVVANKEINNNKKCRQIAGDSDCHVYAAVQFRVHCPWSTSRAFLEATGCHHQASACAVLPWRLPWLTILAACKKKTQLFAS
jgi:hypothetical protein